MGYGRNLNTDIDKKNKMKGNSNKDMPITRRKGIHLYRMSRHHSEIVLLSPIKAHCRHKIT